MTYILGINAYHGDVSAVLLRDGELIAALEEERFRRIKHCAGFPTDSIRRCLQIGEITGAAVDHVAVSRDVRANFGRKLRFAAKRRPSPALLIDRVRNSRRVGNLDGPLAEALGIDRSDLPPIRRVEHHPSHLASAFLVSPFEDAAICAIDGFGDFVSTSTAIGHQNRIDVLDRVYFPHSLGMLYTAVTQHLGFPSYGDEFKVMGLAPYGEPEFTQEIRRLVKLRKGGSFELDLRYFRHWNEGVEMEWSHGAPTVGRVYSDELIRLLGPVRSPDDPLTSRHENIARSLQEVYEECAMHVLNGLWERTREPNLCLAGGCAMNSVANGKIRQQTPFSDIYIQPAAGDSGTALGAAFHLWNQVLGRPRRFVMEHAYWGTEYLHAEVAAKGQRLPPGEFALRTCDTDDDLCRGVAQLIADGNVVGWFQGRMEWGSRALGNRSILADPRRSDMRDQINRKIKFREKFRPFAPSLALEALDDYFVDASPDPFMQQVYPVRPEKRQILAAVTHVDGSGRLQTVTARTNPLYYRLIQAFRDLTGVPTLLNTSFNENEPIVESPEQAMDCFLRTQMDVLVINNVIVRRESARAMAAAEA